MGAFTSTSVEYFVAAKVFYDNSAADPNNYGGVQIFSVIVRNANAASVSTTTTLLNEVTLFETLSGSSQTLFPNTEYLDLSGWHNAQNFGLGTTQIVSATDDGTLSGTPNAINKLLFGSVGSSDTSVGIFPGNVDQ